MIDRSKGEEIWRWSTGKSERAELQAALRAVGQRENWDLSLRKRESVGQLVESAGE